MTTQAFDFSVNTLQSLLWRSNSAVNLESLVQFKQDFYDQNVATFWTDWFNNVYNLKTANIFGLGVWAIILGANISIAPDPITPENDKFGFGPLRINFTHAPFAPTKNNIALTAEQARVLLRLRFYQITTSPTVTNINFMLNDIFVADGTAYVEDNLDMTILYVFKYNLSIAIQFILSNYDILLRPAGVSATFLVDP